MLGEALRFAFRQFDYRDLPLFLTDGEVRAKNHAEPQPCHQTSYVEIVNRRGTELYQLPAGGVVNDYVAFYLSPVTAFTYTIHRGNVDVFNPSGVSISQSKMDERMFFVFDIAKLAQTGMQFCFSDLALNSNAPLPNIANDVGLLEQHVEWSLFDEEPLTAHIPEIGYRGVCRYFQNKDTPIRYQNRRQKRMAEFLVRESVPLQLAECIVVPTSELKAYAEKQLKIHGMAIPVYSKPGCFV